MNINMRSYVCDDMLAEADGENVAQTIDQHSNVMGGADYVLVEDAVDKAVLVGVGDGAMEVWLRTDAGYYVWVDTEGVAHRRTHPTGEDIA